MISNYTCATAYILRKKHIIIPSFYKKRGGLIFLFLVFFFSSLNSFCQLNITTPVTTGFDSTTSSTILPPVIDTCPCSIFDPAKTYPILLTSDPLVPMIAGLRFRSATNGFITGARYYKDPARTGTNIAQLWNTSGNLLAQATYSQETASGWQQVNFASPVAISADVTYLISCFNSIGYYSYTTDYLIQGVNNGPLRALGDNEDGPNGVFDFVPQPAYPSNTFRSTNFWVDVVFNTKIGIDTIPPVVISTLPVANETGVNIGASENIFFNKEVNPVTVSSITVELRDALNNLVPASIVYLPQIRKIQVNSNLALKYNTSYKVVVKGGATISCVKDLSGNTLPADYSFSFKTATAPVVAAPEGPGGPVLVISNNANPFSRYPVEIIKACGFNEYLAMDITQVNATVLTSYDVVILGEMPLSGTAVTLLTNWVNAGGTLISFRPDAQLSTLLGLKSIPGSLADKYLKVSTTAGPGFGIVNQTIQYHGVANLYSLNGAASLAMLYSNATTATSFPAVTTNKVGTNGGLAIAFTYDLAKSIIYTRQGNPQWVNQKRDGYTGPIRSDDLFFGNATFDAQPDWVDFDKIAIPQADEQQYLLSNIITQGNLHRKPLPKFWFLPKGLKAAVVMTGDDHGNGGTVGRFNQYLSLSAANTAAAVADWNTIRGTSYIYPNTPITNTQAMTFEAQGFELALHTNTSCIDWTPASLAANFTTQLTQLKTQLPGIKPPATNRTHCIAWSDWASQPKAELLKGIRLDATYYYYPGPWVQNRPGMFTGSGMPMRFADLDGTTIDCYQLPTQITDQSAQDYPFTINQLLDKAIGAEAYYGVFCANIHTDAPLSDQSDAIITSAKAHKVPVVSAKQMLVWLDGRNKSSFNGISWTGSALSFAIRADSGARNIQAMLPINSLSGQLNTISLNGAAINFKKDTIKGMGYAFFAGVTGNYVANYGVQAPVITNIVATANTDGTATISWVTDALSNSLVAFGKTADSLLITAKNDSLVNKHYVKLSSLTAGQTYFFKVSSTDIAGTTSSEAGTPPNKFTIPSTCLNDISQLDFAGGTTDAGTYLSALQGGEVILKPSFREEFNGTALSSSWKNASWNTGGKTLVSGGLVSVNGTHIYTTKIFATGSSVDFLATFRADSYQNIGFSADSSFNAPWVAFGTSGSGDGVYALASNGTSILISAALLNSTHRYRIDWKAGNFLFYVDNNAVAAATISMSIPNAMVIQASCFSSTGPALDLNDVYATPYALSGSFVSRIFDAGMPVTWAAASWITDTTGTSNIRLLQRQGNSPMVDSSWTSFMPIVQTGTVVGGVSRYFQYRADLNSTNTSNTPVLKQFGICAVNNISAVVPTVCLGDFVKSDFELGITTAGTYLSGLQNGAVILKPGLTEAFPGMVLSAAWKSMNWNSGGKTTLNDGTISVNGTHIYSTKKYSSGSSIDFAATFRADSYQNIGFATDSAFNAPWVAFGTSGSGDGVYALASNGASTLISSQLLGSTHRYRIEWNPGSCLFYVDNNPIAVATITIDITGNMVIQASCFSATGPALDLNYLYASPYAATGSFVSQIFDAGMSVNWLNASWLTDTSSTGSVRLFQRQGNTPLVDSSWTAFSPMVKSGIQVGGFSRYFQYRADLKTSNTGSTPVLNQFTICAVNKNPPVVLPTTCLTDLLKVDFAKGTPDSSTYFSSLQNGNVILKPGIAEEFTGTALSANWKSANWNTAGTTAVNLGQVTVNGTHIYTTTNYAAGSSIDFLATFRADSYQNIGFSTDSAFNAPWVAFGTSGSGNGVYALASDGTAILLSAALIGTEHRYRMVWRAGSFLFYVDNNPVAAATIALNITNNMVIQASCYSATGPALSVNALYASPYAAAGSYTSRIIDAGASVSWANASWLTDSSATGSIRFFQRQGNTSVVDNTWTSFNPIIKSGNAVGGSSRYIQYRADLQTSTINSTPVLSQFSICWVANNSAAKKAVSVDSLVFKQQVNPPIQLDGLSATKTNCLINISWSVNQNDLVQQFEVASSKDGIQFTTIGTSLPNKLSTQYHFLFTPVNASPVIYIRIKITRNDGTVDYSKIITVPGICAPAVAANLYLYPDPVTNNNDITVAAKQGVFNGRYQVSVMDHIGISSAIKMLVVNHSPSFKLNLGYLPPGKYLLKLVGEQGGTVAAIPFIRL